MSLSQSNPVSQKHHNEFDPSLTTTTKQHMRDFVSKVLTGDLNEVPGIGPMNIQHFLECGGEKGEPIANTYQLIGKFLMMRDTNKDSKANASAFFHWLKSKGVTSHVQDITHAVCLKAEMSFPGLFSEEDYAQK